MKKTKILFCALFTVFSLSVNSSSFATGLPGPPVANSGAVCKAANLGQALLGMGSSQLGIVNNASIPLFVVCTVTFVMGKPADIVVEAIFPGPGNSILCTFRLGVFNDPTFFSSTVTIESGDNGANPDTIPTRGFDTINMEHGAGTVTGLQRSISLNQTVVCALDPGEGIVSVSTIDPPPI